MKYDRETRDAGSHEGGGAEGESGGPGREGNCVTRPGGLVGMVGAEGEASAGQDSQKPGCPGPQAAWCPADPRGWWESGRAVYCCQVRVDLCSVPSKFCDTGFLGLSEVLMTGAVPGCSGGERLQLEAKGWQDRVARARGITSDITWSGKHPEARRMKPPTQGWWQERWASSVETRQVAQTCVRESGRSPWTWSALDKAGG